MGDVTSAFVKCWFQGFAFYYWHELSAEDPRAEQKKQIQTKKMTIYLGKQSSTLYKKAKKSKMKIFPSLNRTKHMDHLYYNYGNKA